MDSEAVKASKKRWRENNKDKVREIQRLYRLDGSVYEKNNLKNRTVKFDSKAKANKKYRMRNILKYTAHNAVTAAIRDGRLAKKPCAVCGFWRKVQAHHDDYTKLLEVIWLCVECHNNRHKEINEINRKNNG